MVRLRQLKPRLQGELKETLSRSCMHVKGHGGAKRCVGIAHHMSRRYPFIARFDIRHYYESIDHEALLDLLKRNGAGEESIAVVEEYLKLPDMSASGKGMIAGGVIYPLLGALYLLPLDTAMKQREKGGGIIYRRYMDDFFIFADTRWKLRKAIKEMYRVLGELKLTVHTNQKRFIGRTKGGFDFLGYRVSATEGLQPSTESIRRRNMHIRRLHEQGAGKDRLRQYVIRWRLWLCGGVGELMGEKRQRPEGDLLGAVD
ncbi:RNA-directed DNA polymerase [Chlorobium sp. N1]|nr:RNA-directed DNA polymerase [Chlorobium sp. N1]